MSVYFLSFENPSEGFQFINEFGPMSVLGFAISNNDLFELKIRCGATKEALRWAVAGYERVSVRTEEEHHNKQHQQKKRRKFHVTSVGMSDTMDFLCAIPDSKLTSSSVGNLSDNEPWAFTFSCTIDTSLTLSELYQHAKQVQASIKIFDVELTKTKQS